MNKDIVSIIAKLLKRNQMHKINKQYHMEYDVFDDNGVIENITKEFLFNYREHRCDGEFIYNLLTEYCYIVGPLPKYYF